MFNRLNNPNSIFSRPKYPGVLWDGNTAAWYKHDDMRTVFRDGANRTSYWLDRYNYAVGANILPNPLNFMNVAWGVSGGGVKIDNDSFSSVAAGGLNNAGILWTLNTTYRLRARLNVTAASTLSIRDFNLANVYYTYTGTGAMQTIEVCFTVTAIGVNGILLRLSAAAQVDFEYCIIEPIAGNHLIQNTGANQPIWSMANGLLFDGANDYLKTLPFVFVQPEFIYFVGRQITWTLNDAIYDGNALDSGKLYQAAASPGIRGNAGIVSASDANFILNIFAIVRVLFLNGALTSFIRVNDLAATTWNGGAANMGGFTLGANGTPANYSNIQAKEIIIRRSADNAVVQQQIYDYLRSSNGL